MKRSAVSLLGACLIAACGSGPESTQAPATTAATVTSAATATSAPTGISGLYYIGEGRMLYLECIGEGSPTIVIDVGNDDTIHGSWSAVFQPMADISHTCAYDRANLGRSGPNPGPRTIADLGDELLALLDVAGVEGPYVFVGGSFGGNIVTTLAARHPEAVAGLVLIDSQPAHEFEDNPLPRNLSAAQLDECCADFELPAWDAPDNREHVDYIGGFEEELAGVANQPDVPTVVLTATDIECRSEWPCEAILEDEAALQARWIEGNPLGTQVMIESGHVMQRENPDAIVDHTRAVVEQVRSG
jgi:pimeloyl-ACP methyl ester carboxylesterase